MIDIFSKFVYLKPLKSKETAVVADALQDILLTDSAPQTLQSDNGKVSERACTRDAR